MKSYLLFLVLVISTVACHRPRDGRAGIDGNNGAPGSDGTDGYSTVLRSSQASIPMCASGSGLIIEAGLDLDRNHVLDNNEVDPLETNFVCNGERGHDGSDGENALPSAYSVATTIDPCGDKPGVADEVFLVLENGQILASFSDNASGANTRFSFLTPGSFQTTDGSACKFDVVANPTAQKPDQVSITNERY